MVNSHERKCSSSPENCPRRSNTRRKTSLVRSSGSARALGAEVAEHTTGVLVVEVVACPRRRGASADCEDVVERDVGADLEERGG